MGRMGYKGVATPHGFRSLATDVLNENGFNSDVVERQFASGETITADGKTHTVIYNGDTSQAAAYRPN